MIKKFEFNKMLLRNFLFLYKTIFLSILFYFFSNQDSRSQSIQSPNKVLELNFKLAEDGSPSYTFKAEGITIIESGKMGFVFDQDKNFYKDFRIDTYFTNIHLSSWEPVWGEERRIWDHHHYLKVRLIRIWNQRTERLDLEFKLFNNGLGFRYTFPLDGQLGNFIIKQEITEFPLKEDYNSFWIPGDYDSNEYFYTNSKLSEIKALNIASKAEIGFQTLISDSLIQSPLLLVSEYGQYLAIHEADLRHYPAMQLEVNRSNFNIQCHLVPNSLGHKAYLMDGDKTPWRVILFSKEAKDLLTNRVILNLNDGPVVENTEFIKPGKFVGVWWEMHVGKSLWQYWDKNGSNDRSKWTVLKNHGANTHNVKRYIDFASKNNIPYVLVEGWNMGWENWYGLWKEEVFSFTNPYPDFDMHGIHKYAKSKNVQLIMHHETSGSVNDYERKLDSSIALMKSFHYPGIKGGYVGRIIPRGEHHDGQYMIDHYERTAYKLALNQLTCDLHESVRPTGLHRKYPNWWTNEAARGNEFNAWSKGNPPDHETILPFTRLLGGPMDYTPGIFQIKMNSYDVKKTEQVHTTLAKQLALYVTIYSPLQMAADIIENYEKKPDAFQFIKDVPTDWDSTIILDAIPGDYLYTVRKEKNKENWYLGAITDENERILEFEPSFLIPNTKYNMTIYRDGDQAHWQSEPMNYKIEKRTVRSKDKIKIRLASGGGCAVQFTHAGSSNR